MRKAIRQGGWYGDSTLEGDDVTLYRDSHIEITYSDGNFDEIELPFKGNNILQLVCTRWNGQVLIAGAGHHDDRVYLFKDGKWKNLDKAFATFACAFGPGSLYLVVAPNQYRIYDLESEILGPVINRKLGSNGIRYISFPQSPDGIVTGDSTYGPAPYNLSEFTSLDDTIIGQSWKNNQDDLVALLLEDTYYKLNDGHCKFIRVKRSGNNLAISTVNETKVETIHFWLTVDELKQFPRFNPFIGSEAENKPPTKPPVKEENMPSQTPPNKKSTVQRMLKLHPEVDIKDESKRGKIVDFVIKAEGGKPWGRKARNKDGSNKNTDGLTWLIPGDAEQRFYIIDVIVGIDDEVEEDRTKYASWDVYGPFKPGENGYWAEGEEVDGSSTVPKEPTKPEPKALNINKDEVRAGANEIINFYTSDEGLRRSKPPIDVNDQAAWDWVAVFLTSLTQGKSPAEAVEDVKSRIRTFQEWKDKHK